MPRYLGALINHTPLRFFHGCTRAENGIVLSDGDDAHGVLLVYIFQRNNPDASAEKVYGPVRSGWSFELK